jgi:hypothetical protein
MNKYHSPTECFMFNFQTYNIGLLYAQLSNQWHMHAMFNWQSIDTCMLYVQFSSICQRHAIFSNQWHRHAKFWNQWHRHAIFSNLWHRNAICFQTNYIHVGMLYVQFSSQWYQWQCSYNLLPVEGSQC